MSTFTSFEVPARITAQPRLSERHPWIYPLAVLYFRTKRRLAWLRSDVAWARDRGAEPLPVRIKKHGSVLLRELSAEEMVLQRNKVVNLQLASSRLDSVLIRPGETFSFNRTVGNCTRRKGYTDGMRLSNGDAISGVGGGICQLANLLHWMFLHSPLTIVERSEHSFDPFPDKNRVLPWGVGCSIVYNYVDLVVRNDTPYTFQLKVWVGSQHLKGELRADQLPELTYRVQGRDDTFWRQGERTFRTNEIWRTVHRRTDGSEVGEELVKRNCALVKYEPTGPVIDVP